MRDEPLRRKKRRDMHGPPWQPWRSRPQLSGWSIGRAAHCPLTRHSISLEHGHARDDLEELGEVGRGGRGARHDDAHLLEAHALSQRREHLLVVFLVERLAGAEVVALRVQGAVEIPADEAASALLNKHITHAHCSLLLCSLLISPLTPGLCAPPAYNLSTPSYARASLYEHDRVGSVPLHHPRYAESGCGAVPMHPTARETVRARWSSASEPGRAAWPFTTPRRGPPRRAVASLLHTWTSHLSTCAAW